MSAIRLEDLSEPARTLARSLLAAERARTSRPLATPGVPMRAPVPLEHDEQVEVLAWADLNADRWPELAYLHAIPNGGGRGKRDAGRLKMEGVKAGVPDLRLDAARGGWFGLAVEMKRRDATLSDVAPEQRRWLTHLRAQGYATVVAAGAAVAIDALATYLRLPPTPQPRRTRAAWPYAPHLPTKAVTP